MNEIFDIYAYSETGDELEVFIQGFNCAVYDASVRPARMIKDIYDLCVPDEGDLWGAGYKTACDMMWLFV